MERGGEGRIYCKKRQMSEMGVEGRGGGGGLRVEGEG